VNRHRWLYALFVILALASCETMATEPGQAPAASYRDNEGMNRGPDM